MTPSITVNKDIIQLVSGVSGGDAFNVKANGSTEQASYSDFRSISEPASPPFGTIRLFATTVTGVRLVFKAKFTNGVVRDIATN